MNAKTSVILVFAIYHTELAKKVYPSQEEISKAHSDDHVKAMSCRLFDHKKK